MRIRAIEIAVGVVCVAYAALHVWSISWFPFVHSDEVWLASLTRTMIAERSFAATEEFFVLTPRYPHAIKTLFHAMQAPFVAVSFSAVSVRLVSVLALVGALGALYTIVRRLGGARPVAATVTAAAAFDLQIVYASHTGRQEIVLVAVMLIAIAVAVAPPERRRPGRHGAIVGAIVGATVFVHPNSLLVALAVVPWIAWATRDGGRRAIATAVVAYGTVLATVAIAAVAASFTMDPQFLTHYLAFGESVGVEDSGLRRLFRFIGFIEKLWFQRAGTYYLPPIRVQLVFLALAVPISAGVAIVRRRVLPVVPVASLVLVAIGIFAIGKYSPPSAVFLVPWIYLAIAAIILDRRHGTRGARRFGFGGTAAAAVAIAVTAAIAVAIPTVIELNGMRPGTDRHDSYQAYLGRIGDAVDDADGAGRVLANLNTGFLWERDRLRTYRDLARLPTDQPDALESFLRREEVRFLVVPVDELATIYDLRPLWNDVYGNPNRFVPELRSIIADHATLIDEFPSPVYGMRILAYRDRTAAQIRVYSLSLP
jgi:hypothetical protein